MHSGGGERKVDPFSKILEKLFYKNAIKPQKGVLYPKKKYFTNGPSLEFSTFQHIFKWSVKAILIRVLC
jgi:hypothetical protein